MVIESKATTTTVNKESQTAPAPENDSSTKSRSDHLTFSKSRKQNAKKFEKLKLSTIAKHDPELARELQWHDGPTSRRGYADPHEIALLTDDLMQAHHKLVQEAPAKDNSFDPYKIDDIATRNEKLAAALRTLDGPSSKRGVADAHEVAKLSPELQDRYKRLPEIIAQKLSEEGRELADIQMGAALMMLALGLTTTPLAAVAYLFGGFIAARVSSKFAGPFLELKSSGRETDHNPHRKRDRWTGLLRSLVVPQEVAIANSVRAARIRVSQTWAASVRGV